MINFSAAGCEQSLASLGLQQHRSPLSLHLHKVVFTLYVSVSPSSYDGISHGT